MTQAMMVAASPASPTQRRRPRRVATRSSGPSRSRRGEDVQEPDVRGGRRESSRGRSRRRAPSGRCSRVLDLLGEEGHVVPGIRREERADRGDGEGPEERQGQLGRRRRFHETEPRRRFREKQAARRPTSERTLAVVKTFWSRAPSPTLVVFHQVRNTMTRIATSSTGDSRRNFSQPDVLRRDRVDEDRERYLAKATPTAAIVRSG